MNERISEQPLESPLQEVVLFDRHNVVNHNKNLHGEGRYVQGLTGFYHHKFYLRGVHQPNKKNGKL